MTMVLEEERLDLSLEDSPPCTVNVEGHSCGQPATARLRVHCDVCAWTSVGFICKDHYEALLAGLMSCTQCKTDYLTWKET